MAVHQFFLFPYVVRMAQPARPHGHDFLPCSLVFAITGPQGVRQQVGIAAVNAAFGTDIDAAEFTQLIVGVNQEIVSVAQSQLGNEGGQPYWSWYGFESRVEWCACFVSWCADQCGYIDRGICPKFSLCSDGVNWFQQRNQWLAGTETPSPGMIIFFDWADNGQDGVSDHVGIVASVENGTVHTIEGNSGDACRERSYSVGYYEILGYGVLQVGGETDNSNNETPTQ